MKIARILGAVGMIALFVTGCSTKQTAVMNQSPTLGIGANIDRDALVRQRDFGWTLKLPSDSQ